MLGKPSTRLDSDFASVLTSTDCSNSKVFFHVELQKKILLANREPKNEICEIMGFVKIF